MNRKRAYLLRTVFCGSNFPVASSIRAIEYVANTIFEPGGPLETFGLDVVYVALSEVSLANSRSTEGAACSLSGVTCRQRRDRRCCFQSDPKRIEAS